MNVGVLSAVVVLSVLVMLSLGVLLVRDVPVGDRTYAALAAVELVLLAQAVLGVVLLGRTERDVSGILFVSYLVGSLLALPIGAFWSLAERSRAGTGVLAVAVLTVLAVELRLHTIWGGFGA